jgi:membrane-associated phospholipid phosphatase
MDFPMPVVQQGNTIEDRPLPNPWWLGALCLCAASASFAKEPVDYLDDARDYFLAPLHWDQHDWLMAGEVAAVTAVAYTFDSRVQHHFAPAGPIPDGDPNALRDSAPMVAMVLGTAVVGLVTDDPKIRSTAADMTEAVVLASGSTLALKYAFGRQRPNETSDTGAWFSGGDSFPSGHTSAAFAAAQAFADSRPEGELSWRIAAYSLGALTAYARVHDNQHWLSDTVAGAALGMATGRFVSNRRITLTNEHPVRVSIRPMKGGAMLSVAIDPNRFLAW